MEVEVVLVLVVVVVMVLEVVLTVAAVLVVVGGGSTCSRPSHVSTLSVLLSSAEFLMNALNSDEAPGMMPWLVRRREAARQQRGHEGLSRSSPKEKYTRERASAAKFRCSRVLRMGGPGTSPLAAKYNRLESLDNYA